MSATDNYYKIVLSYEVPFNLMESSREDVRSARDILYGRIVSIIPDRYIRLNIRLSNIALPGSTDWLITLELFLKSLDGLPMEEYVNARTVKEDFEKEMDRFFGTIDCDYRQIKVKPLV